MLVINHHRNTALVIRQGARGVFLVPMTAGPLAAVRLDEDEFAADWRTLDYPLWKALLRFNEHARRHGASREVLEGLDRLEESSAAAPETTGAPPAAPRPPSLEDTARRLLELLEEGAITVTDSRFTDAVVRAFDDLEAALHTKESKP